MRKKSAKWKTSPSFAGISFLFVVRSLFCLWFGFIWFGREQEKALRDLSDYRMYTWFLPLYAYVPHNLYWLRTTILIRCIFSFHLIFFLSSFLAIRRFFHNLILLLKQKESISVFAAERKVDIVCVCIVELIKKFS